MSEFKIYTKLGDKGETSLIGGKRVPKYHQRIEAYGTVDELNSFAGLIRDLVDNDRLKKVIIEIQDRLFTAESLLATDHETQIDRKLPVIVESDITFLEEEIDRMNEELPPLTSFILPGGNVVVSYCHVARTVCRRAERIVIRLSGVYPVDPLVIKYLNRLSDYFFVLARYLSHHLGAEEIPWNARV
jgi:cob(I)alamin adenosyltransferase